MSFRVTESFAKCDVGCVGGSGVNGYGSGVESGDGGNCGVAVMVVAVEVGWLEVVLKVVIVQLVAMKEEVLRCEKKLKG